MYPEYNHLLTMLVFLSLWGSCLAYLAPLKVCPSRPQLAAMLLAGLLAGLLSGVLSPWNGWLPQLLNCLYTCAFFRLCGGMPTTAALYCGVWALISQQLAGEVFFQLSVLIPPSMGGFSLWLVLFFLLYAGFCCLIRVTVARWMPRNGRYSVGPRQFTSALFLLLIFELLYYPMMGNGQFSNPLAPLFILLAQFYCVTMLYLQHTLFAKSAMQQELGILNRLRYEQKEQYDLSKETIAIINRKCHDLKHQMAALQAIASPEQREKYLREIADSVRIYDAIYQTGNEVLDTVLTEKSLQCEANQITVSCVADGSKLGFLDPVDLYTVLGNALDNAIECVHGLQEAERRIIDVLICVERQFLVIQVTNPLGGSLTFEDGLPLSTKPHNGYHGFGLKSIRHTVERYGGFLTVSTEHQSFALKILIPLPK